MIRFPRLASILAVASIAAIATPAAAALVPNGVSINGTASNALHVNGTALNALTLNGVQPGAAAPLVATLPSALDLPR